MFTIPESPQEVFEIVAKHLLKQGRKSISDTVSYICLYRGPDGLKCAAGVLIPDECYIDTIEGETWIHLTDSSVPFQFAPDTNRQLVSQLQNLHDVVDVIDWFDDLKELAQQHNLNSDFMDELAKECNVTTN